MLPPYSESNWEGGEYSCVYKYFTYKHPGARGSVDSGGTMLQAGKSGDGFPIRWFFQLT
jgi:hypothetical protein